MLLPSEPCTHAFACISTIQRLKAQNDAVAKLAPHSLLPLPLPLSQMVETRSGLSIEPPEASHVHEDTAATAAPATPPRLRRQRASSQPSDRPDGLNDSQAYTLLALSLGLLALPLMLVPSLVSTSFSAAGAAISRSGL